MTTYSKFNIIYRLQKWLDSVPGQTFMNYAYSWGASIVILGALFKLTHLPGANFMLFLGMGTEVFVFFIAGFDRPFDKTEDGKELPTHVMEEEENADVAVEGAVQSQTTVLGGMGGSGTIILGGSETGAAENGEPVTAGGTTVIGGGGTVIGGGGTVIGGGGTVVGGGEPVMGGGTVIGGGTIIGGGAPTPELPEIDAEEMEEATAGYVEQLKKLTETLQKVSEQSERLTRDSEEMENLNRTLTGICKVYEMQLKGASRQISTIDEINDQTTRMAGQIAELNAIYARMIEAMTTNMPKVVKSEE